MRTGYKVVWPIRGQLSSMFAPCPVRYAVGAWTEAPEGAGPIHLFADLEAALQWAEAFRKRIPSEIWLARYRPWKARLPRFLGEAIWAWQGDGKSVLSGRLARSVGKVRLAEAVYLERRVAEVHQPAPGDS